MADISQCRPRPLGHRTGLTHRDTARIMSALIDECALYKQDVVAGHDFVSYMISK